MTRLGISPNYCVLNMIEERTDGTSAESNSGMFGVNINNLVRMYWHSTHNYVPRCQWMFNTFSGSSLLVFSIYPLDVDTRTHPPQSLELLG